MNQHVEVPYAMREFQALMRHCRGSRRRAHEYKQWALAEAATGHFERYRRYRQFSDNSWADAKDALFQAKMLKARMQ